MSKFKDTVLFIRSKKDTIVNCITVVTDNFMKRNNYYCFKDAFKCTYFEVYENIGGDVFIKTYTHMKHSGVAYTNEIKIDRNTIEEMRMETLT